MTTLVDFYFDFSSPYGYFASTRIEALAEKHGRIVRWHPILLGVVFKTTGSAPLSSYPLKGEYSLHDFERTARFHGIPYKSPEEFPLATQSAARAKLWIEKNKGADKAIIFCKEVYRAYFVDGLNITRPEVLAEVASSMDIDGAAMIDGSNNILIKEELKSQIEIAMTKGVFGSPFIIVDKEPFWGFDRFAQLEAFLKNGKV
ncbi:MAG: 2-hydroxychromene-2-carboxylate isomerase [Burkholderiales bacterium]|nr:2-hydroxychromene-2-carboxylate isomerase [Burkholderiales bacterium]